MPGSEPISSREVITEAKDLKRGYMNEHFNAHHARASKESHFAEQLASKEVMDRYSAAIAQIDEAKVTIEAAAKERIARSEISVAQDADSLASELREYERKLSVLGEARKVLEDILEGTTSEKDEHLAKRHEAYQAESLADTKAKSNLYDAGVHFRANEEVYKEEAVKDAQFAGAEVNYPPYTAPEVPAEPTPAASEGADSGHE